MKAYLRILLAFLPFLGCSHNSPRSEDPFSLSEWTIYQGSLSGKPIFIRANTALKSLIHRERFGYKVGFTVLFLNPKADGLPTNEEMNQLNGIEDQIEAAMRKDSLAFPAVVITTGGLREFVFYSGQPAAVRRQIAILGGRVGGHDVQSYVEPDSSWATYQQFTK